MIHKIHHALPLRLETQISRFCCDGGILGDIFLWGIKNVKKLVSSKIVNFHISWFSVFYVFIFFYIFFVLISEFSFKLELIISYVVPLYLVPFYWTFLHIFRYTARMPFFSRISPNHFYFYLVCYFKRLCYAMTLILYIWLLLALF